MPHPDPDELMIAAVYPDRTLLFSWRPAEPGVRVVIAPADDGPDVVVTLEQDADTDAILMVLRRLVLRLPAKN